MRNSIFTFIVKFLQKLLKLPESISLSSEQPILNVSFHNSKVKENREILKILIDGACFLAKQELVFRGNDETALFES